MLMSLTLPSISRLVGPPSLPPAHGGWSLDAPTHIPLHSKHHFLLCNEVHYTLDEAGFGQNQQTPNGGEYSFIARFEENNNTVTTLPAEQMDFLALRVLGNILFLFTRNGPEFSQL